MALETECPGEPVIIQETCVLVFVGYSRGKWGAGYLVSSLDNRWVLEK